MLGGPPRRVKVENRARAVTAAEAMAKPLATAAVVLPKRVEGVGGLPDLLGEVGHLGDAAGVVGDRDRRRRPRS
jgi:hypothetical protein